MLKQFLSKLPRKSSKPDTIESPRRGSGNSSSSNSGDDGGGLQRTTSGTMVSIRSNATKRTSSVVFPSSVVTGIEPLLAFRDVPSSERLNLFISKLSLCNMVFDFTDPSKSTTEKDLKRVTLIELVDFVASCPPKFTESAMVAMCKMCENNLFRVFPPNYQSNSGGSENDDDEPMFDPAWPHLQIVYDLLLHFVTSSLLEAKVAKKYINHSFILRLLDLFDSEDPRERECLKTILHRIYGKFMVHRPFIRKSIGNVFYRFIFETERHNGIAELLEIFGSVISGFAVPLKEEHKIFLGRALVPLHKPKSLGVYFQQLSFCVTQFIEKEPKLALNVIRGLLKYWPITNTQKEVMLLSELEEIVEGINMGEFQKVMVPLFWRIGCCINSSHFQVLCFIFSRTGLYWNCVAHVSDSGRYVTGINRYGREIHSHRYTGEYPIRDSNFPVRTGRKISGFGFVIFVDEQLMRDTMNGQNIDVNEGPTEAAVVVPGDGGVAVMGMTMAVCLGCDQENVFAAMAKEGSEGVERRNWKKREKGTGGILSISLIFLSTERALFFWNNDQIVNLIAHNRHVILPIIFPALERNIQCHWNQSVLNLSLNVRKLFTEMDDGLVVACHAHFKEEQANLSVAAEKRKETWEQLENAASLQPITGNTAVLVTLLATSITC
ncbi:hypothetical protein TEA_005693 [Camellia sinensis var. sinensis]|uniref:Serine/threonine protein phosphatase 2A regulatory subunit n=1 Tax=Camellia sinensis var. sinensis TaxID=542762 RepID=A0A4S4DKH8_CAMSN|nr:hypothetical protein TEA_005693 [Camellia sinensis var. sinensis]